MHSTTRVECILPKFEGGFAPEGTDPRESGNDYAPVKGRAATPELRNGAAQTHTQVQRADGLDWFLPAPLRCDTPRPAAASPQRTPVHAERRGLRRRRGPVSKDRCSPARRGDGMRRAAQD